jgi:eukaryotic-like serine/threonine-protein kinase
MKLLSSGTQLDGFTIDACIYHGSMAHIYSVHYSEGHASAAIDPGFPMLMKVPRMTPGDGAETIVSFEVEQQIMQDLSGVHVPRFVAAGDLEHMPYLVMEHVSGQTLQDWLDAPQLPSFEELASLGAAVAAAAQSLHQQNTVHHDLKPANVIVRPDGSVVLIDFGLSCHAHFPDLLAEELRKAVGSPAWIAPEQIVGVRGDLRSDIFAIGVMLYQLATGAFPFGEPQTVGGMRQRLWMDPPPPRKLKPQVPPWLQEIIMRCLEPEAAKRYPSAAHLAFDLRHPDHIIVTDRGYRTAGTGFVTHFKRWLSAAGMDYKPSALPIQQLSEVPIVMVALPHKDAQDATLYALRKKVENTLGTRPGAKLACVTVISDKETQTTSDDNSETSVHRKYLSRLRHWAQPLDLTGHQASYHVLESGDVAQALLDYAAGNHVSVIVLGAATHGLMTQRLVATVPIKVAMNAPCTVILVKQPLPFALLEQAAES